MTWLVLCYCIGGIASQKLVPGVDEIFPFFGWSLFSKIPTYSSRYTILIHEHDGQPVSPALSFHEAPGTMVTGSRPIGRKLIQNLGRARDRGDDARVAELRRLFEANYLRGKIRYELVFEGYEPLQKWRSGENTEERSVASFESGVFHAN